MPAAWYRAQQESGRLTDRHLALAAASVGRRRSAIELAGRIGADQHLRARMPLMTDIADAGRARDHEMSWNEYVVRHVSQSCAAFFDEGQAQWGPQRTDGLYELWCRLARHDRGPRVLMGLRGFRDAVSALPRDPRTLIADALDALEVPAEEWPDYLTALLLSVNGWASACAFRRWDARLTGGNDDQIVHLLAVRLAWEVILFRLEDSTATSSAWYDARNKWRGAEGAGAHARADDWIIQCALELSYQEEISRALTDAFSANNGAAELPSARPAADAQTVFCIDVRSEVMRRAIERVAPAVHTLGFAGFFGLPVAYQPLLGPARAHLPGLLAPSLVVADVGAHRASAVARASRALQLAAAWKSLGRTAASTFSLVESVGFGWVGALLRDSFALSNRSGDPLRALAPTDGSMRPEIIPRADCDARQDLAARIAMASGILRAMSLTTQFAPIVALIGHGASTENNPLAAGLHCGACGGQTGEVNARALSALLNDHDVRIGLAALGIDLSGTHVVAGLHDTTTDDITWYDMSSVPSSHSRQVEQLSAQFVDAGRVARRERAEALGLGAVADDALCHAVRARARNWSEVRPEWGLANNAAFIVAPRTRTEHINLGGRSFLHDYAWQRDEGFKVLELIMTAPMVVTHWINMQYYASTVDPQRYGSGNKVLHNVVGGTTGVLEGAGGDLRIGLAAQSVHDGTRWMHEPLRLSVYLEAPRGAIDLILARHATVRSLVENGWLYLHRIDPFDGTIYQRDVDGWHLSFVP
ncbi:MAG: DUF2309 domain-containing protein [Gemmatimonadaceae bacterium]